MFVITADQIDSTNDIDRAGIQLAELNAAFASDLVLPADQNSGDEIQAMVADPAVALDIILAINRTQHWSIGVGIGPVKLPLADATRKATGGAFIAARRAVAAAKRSPARFCLHSANENPETVLSADQVEALITMTLLLRGRRTEQGWEVVDLLARGLNQREIARELAISVQAVSMRIKASLWKAEQSAKPALVRLLDDLDSGSDGRS